MAKSPSQRRHLLLERMANLESQGVDCSQCRGTCCTFEANSMQATPQEALDIYFYLRDNQLFHKDLIAKLLETIRDYRLDAPAPSDGRRNFSRRTYTCPFLTRAPLACSIPKEVKPYGCLGFNASNKGEKVGTSCSSDQKLLQDHDASLSKETLEDFWWDKLPMPVALLEVAKAHGAPLPETT